MPRMLARPLAALGSAVAVATLVPGLPAWAPPAAAATGSPVIDDARTGTTAGTLQYAGSWSLRRSAALSGGTEHVSSTPGAAVTVRCWCSRVVLYGTKGPGSGLASVTLDGRTITVDSWAATTAAQQVLWSSPVLPREGHVLTLVVKGAHRDGATGSAIALDRAVVPADYLVVSRAALMSLPMTGGAWSSLKAYADSAPGSVALADQNSNNPGHLFAKALVYARTGDASYRAAVVSQLAQVPLSPLATAQVLAVGRQLAGYAMAADLVGYRDPAFVSFMSGMRTRYLGNHGRWTALNQTSDDTANNWGAWATASRVAIDRYVGDRTDLARAATVVRGFLGDASAHRFRPTADFDPSFACGGATAWVPINPAGCGDRDGAVVEDISRSAGAWPVIDSVARTYSWETLGGLVLAARLLKQGGYADVWSWSDKALLRAGRFLQGHAAYPPLYSVNQHIPWAINKAYGVALGPVAAAGAGRQFGFTDWLP